MDKDKGAVDIARLRFWLSLVVDEDEPQELPNLDFKIMQGDSLLERFAGIRLDNLLQTEKVVFVLEHGQTDMFGKSQGPQAFSDEKKKNLEALLKDYFLPKQEDKASLKQQIDRIAHEHIEYNIELLEHSLYRQKNEAEGLRSQINFNKTDALGILKKKEKKSQDLQRQIDICQKELDRLAIARAQLLEMEEKEADRPFFLWHLFFKEVFDTGGFDIVIGNPPYVRADGSDEYMKQRREIEAGGNYETLWEKWDLFIPFIEKGFKILKPKGVITFIVSDAYCHAKYAQKSQNWFLQNSRILRLDFIGELQVFDAAVRNVIFFFQNDNGQTHLPELRLHRDFFGNVINLTSVPQAEATHRLFFPAEKSSIEISVPTLTLEEICYISVGMVVHADEKMAKGEFELKDLISAEKNEMHPKPFVEGKYLNRWLPAKNKWLEWDTERAPSQFRRQTFPEMYMVPEKLISVDISGNGTGAKVAFDNGQLFHNHSAWSFVPWHHLEGVRNKSLQKVARYADEKPRPDLPTREILEQNSKNFDLKFLLGVMNSAFAWKFLRENRRSNLHIFPDDWKPLAIPIVNFSVQQLIIHVVDYLLYLSGSKHEPLFSSVPTKTLIQFFEEVLDGCVFELYFSEHMAERSIAISEDISQVLAGKEIIGLQENEVREHIRRVYQALSAPESVVRQRMTLFGARSPEVLLPLLHRK